MGGYYLRFQGERTGGRRPGAGRAVVALAGRRAPGFAVTGGERYGLYTFDGDLRENTLFFDLSIRGNTGSAQELPSIDLYVGSLQVVPEPGTIPLTATGLVGVFALVRQRRGGRPCGS